MKILKKSWFALVLSMMLVLVIVLVAMVVLEIAIPFSRNIKWIENSSNAYYQANTWVEWALRFVSQNTVWTESTNPYVWKSLDSKYNITATWQLSPVPWKWDSDFDKDWSKISQWSPIQMQVWYWKITFSPNEPKAYFRVPNFSLNSWLWVLELNWWNLSIINWQLSWVDETLNALPSNYIVANNICKSTVGCNSSTDAVNLSTLVWKDLAWVEYNFKDFYDTNCWNLKSCILKLSVINKLELKTNNTIIPYLEWKIDFWSSVPTRVAEIDVSWKSYGFRKDISVWVPQKTLNDSFDFTIFQ